MDKKIEYVFTKEPAGMLFLAGHAGWNQTMEDCRMVTSSDNSLAVYALAGEKIIGCAGCFIFGDRQLGHINMVVTHEDYRGRGIAKTMVKMLMEKAACRTYRLYATPSGGHVYTKLGFVPLLGQRKYFASCKDFPVMDEMPEGIFPVTEKDLEEMYILDEKIFGFPRRKIMEYLFRTHPELAFCHRDPDGKMNAFTLGRIGPAARNIMCSSIEPSAAQKLFFYSCTLKSGAEKLQTMIYDNQENFRKILLEKGFTEGVNMNLMDWGEHFPLPDTGCYGIAGGEFG